MNACGIFACCAFKTFAKVALFVSHWSLIQAFVQATMWHNTEPKTLGVCYWATGLLLAGLCLPGLLFFLISAIFPATKSQSQRYSTLKKLVCCLVRVIPALMLTISSSPILDEVAAIRTWILSCGVIFISLYVIMIAWKKYNTIIEDIPVSNTKCPPVDKQSACFVFRSRSKHILKNLMTSANIGSDVVISVFVDMCVRWCYDSINIFYENWKASIVLMIVVIVYAGSEFISEHVGEGWNVFASVLLDKTDVSTECNGNHVIDDKVQAKTFKSYTIERDSLSEDKYPRPNTLQYDEKDPDVHTDLLRDKIISQNSNEHQLDAIAKDGAIVASIPSDGVQALCVKTSQCYAIFYAILLAVAIGSLSSLSLWIFTSPDDLCLWGEIPTYSFGNLILACFAIGCLVAIFVDVGSLCNCQNAQPFFQTSPKFQITRLRLSPLRNSFLFIIVIIGTSLILYTKQRPFLFGSSILCLSFPLLFRIIIFSSVNLTSTCKKLQTPGKRQTINIAPGFLLFFSGFVFFVLHCLKIMFINPQLSSIVHGRIDVITWLEVVFGLLPLVFCPMLEGKIGIVDRLRSSSTGPLLSPDSEKATPHCYENFHRQVTSKEFFQMRKYRKTSQALFIILVFIVVSISKYQSVQSRTSCDLSAPVCVEANSENNYDLRVMSWNILLGHKMNGRNNLDSITKIADEYDPHVLALQEANTLPAYWGGKNAFGYLQQNSKSCREMGKVVNPMQGAFEVGMLSTLEIINKSSMVLPRANVQNLPSYAAAKISCRVRLPCKVSDEIGSGSGITPPRRSSTLHFYTLHAVYKNWTCERSSDLSQQQMAFLHDDIRKLPTEDPVIVMGDFNINPSESELDIWFNSDLGFKSALWLSRQSLNDSSNTMCKSNCPSNDNKCICDCLNNSSNPPNSTLLNRPAAVDHIFYRGLRLVGEGQILRNVYDTYGNVSDHYPILADFAYLD